MTESYLFIKGNSNKNKLIVSFGGQGLSVGQIPPFEFLNYLKEYIPDIDKIFIIDNNQCWYHKGLKSLTTDIPSTVIF